MFPNITPILKSVNSQTSLVDVVDPLSTYPNLNEKLNNEEVKTHTKRYGNNAINKNINITHFNFI